MNLLIIIIIFALYLLLIKTINKVVTRIGTEKSVDVYRIKYINKTLGLFLTALFIAVLLLVLGIQFAQLSIFISSLFAVIGVALFAQWSILSNITASLIIFFFFPYRVGSLVKVVDPDDDISGVIEEISLFHVIIRRENDLITYPNSLILQRAVIKIDSLVEEDTLD
jgi:small-conductance mechanosensitive channel